MKLVAMLRTKNTGPSFKDCLSRLSALADEIVILDNGSTDDTLEVCRTFPKVVQVLLRNDTGDYHEGRDMRLMLDEAKKRNPDWILFVCSDEVFEKNMTRADIDRYMRGKYDRIAFRMCNFWLSTKYCRFDRDWFRYTLRTQRMMWRNLPEAFFEDRTIHAASLRGIESPVYTSPFRIKHYGYAFPEDIVEKTRLYRSIDKDRNQYKYNSGDPESEMNKAHILLYPFLEFGNSHLNYLYIVLYRFVCDILLTAVNFKRKYLRGLKVFPGVVQ